MYVSRGTSVVPVSYDVQHYPPPSSTHLGPTYVDNSYRRRPAGSYCGSCCCLIGLVIATILAAALAVGLYFIIKSAIDEDSNKPNTATSNMLSSTTGTLLSTIMTSTIPPTSDTP